MSRKNNSAAGISELLAGRLDSHAGKAVLRAIASFLTGLLASRATILGGLTPFGIAAVAAVSRSDSIFTLFGACIGYLLPHGPEFQVKYIAASIMVFIFKWIFSGLEAITQHTAFSPTLAAVGCALAGATVVVSSGLQIADIVKLSAEVLICACSAMFFEQAIPLLMHPSKLWGLTRHELICIVITYCVLLLAVSRVNLSGISLGRILAVLTILIAARYGYETGGCIMGAASGLILGLGDKNMMFILGGYAFGGLMAGIFAPISRFGCTVAFILANAVACISSTGASLVVTCFYEVLAATVIFMVIPEKFLCRLSAAFFPAKETAGLRSAKSGVSARLTEAAAALTEVADTVTQVGSRLKTISTRDVSSIYTDAADISCKRCGMRMYCWGTAYNDTMSALNDMTALLEKNGGLAREDVPRHFAGRCCRLGDLLSAINRCYGEYNARGCAQRKAEFLRGLLIEEFSGLSLFLRELGVKVSGNTEISRNSDEIRAAFAVCGLSVTDSVFSKDEKGHVSIDAVIDKKGKTAIKKEELLEELSTVSGRELDGPFVMNDSKLLTLNFTQRPAFTCAFGKAAIKKNGEKLCGDAADAYIDDGGRAVMILSDGMGCGGSAAVDSNMALKLMSRLIRSDFSYASALQIVNAAMMLKSGEESFATLDIASIDLFTGQAEFLKAGSPPTYLRRCGKVERVSQASMPVGILRGVKLERSAAKMRPGDLIVIASDGVLCEDDGWLIKMIEAYEDEFPDSFAQKVAQKAKELRQDGHDDDITVMAAVMK